VPLLSDPVRGVRVRGADLLAAVPAANQLAADRRAFDRATAEFVAAQLLNADRPEARLTLGSFHARRGETAEAEAEYKAALRIAPQFAPAAVNLAAFIGRRRGAVGEVVLRAAIAASPKDAGLHYALGLALIRLKRSGDALTELQKAAKLAPENVHCANVYGIALNSTGQSDQARKTLADAVARHPHNREILTALVQIGQQAGDLDSALRYAESLATLTPNDENL
jgi:Flp pilus assembly protein TadD